MLQMPMSKKRVMLSMNTKTMARTQYESPNDYIQYLVCRSRNVAELSLAIFVQDDLSQCSQPPIDIKRKVLF